jgi:hypothetical protein
MISLNFTQPIVFEPLFMERIWGGRRLEMQFGKRLPQECASSNRGRLSTALKRKALCATVHCAVERCMNSGHKVDAQYLLLPVTACWWFDRYQKFREHLEARYPVIVRNDNTYIIFDLRRAAALSDEHAQAAGPI